MSQSLPNEIAIGAEVFSLRDVAESEQDDVIGLHSKVFASSVTPAWYHWKYRAGRGLAMGLWHQGRLVAHCGGIPRVLWLNGQSVKGLQIGDVMVATEWRGLMTRRGPFFHVCNGFYNSKLGASQGYQLGFGFPSERHFRLGFKSGFGNGGYAHEILWASPPSITRWVERLIHDTRQEYPANNGFEKKIEKAWRRMFSDATKRGIMLGDRGFEHVQWRYLQRPDRSYTFFGLYRRHSRFPVGISVVEIPADPSSPWHWIDWIGRESDMPIACLALQRQAHAGGATGLKSWVSDRVELALKNTGITSRTFAARIGIPGTSCVAEDWLRLENWWLMSGDTDFL